jgi:hypothetical protein
VGRPRKGTGLGAGLKEDLKALKDKRQKEYFDYAMYDESKYPLLKKLNDEIDKVEEQMEAPIRASRAAKAVEKASRLKAAQERIKAGLDKSGKPKDDIKQDARGLMGGATAEQKGKAAQMRTYVSSKTKKVLNRIVHSGDQDPNAHQFNEFADSNNNFDPQAEKEIVKATAELRKSGTQKAKQEQDKKDSEKIKNPPKLDTPARAAAREKLKAKTEKVKRERAVEDEALRRQEQSRKQQGRGLNAVMSVESVGGLGHIYPLSYQTILKMVR